MKKSLRYEAGILILLLIVSLSACGSTEPIKVGTFDEGVYEQEFELYQQLTEKFAGKQRYEIKQDPDYEKYRNFINRGYYSLSAFVIAKREQWVNVSATVDLSNSQITFSDGKTAKFKRDSQNNYSFYDYSGTLLEETLTKLVRNAEEESGDLQSKNTSKTIKGILLMLFFAGIGLLIYHNPERYWFYTKGIYYKDTEPSDFALNASKGFGICFMLLGVFLLIMTLR